MYAAPQVKPPPKEAKMSHQAEPEIHHADRSLVLAHLLSTISTDQW